MNYDVMMAVMKLIGGLGLFLYGMHAMSEGLNGTAGDKLKDILSRLTKNRLMGVAAGAGATAIVQSSSAVTVMIVGFVSAGLMTLTQAVGVIMGANIGTTVTAWIVSMGEWSKFLKPDFFAPLLVGVSAAMIISAKDEKKRKKGEIIMGFGLIFMGLSYMSMAIEPYRDSAVFVNSFSLLSDNPLMAIVVGVVVTAIIQSSSASVGILQTLAMSGVVGTQAALFITLGQNIGTCVTAMLAAMGSGTTAKRAAVIHLLFNVIGTVIFGCALYAFFVFNPAMAAIKITAVQISIFHTVFNVVNTLILLPFADKLVDLSCMLVREKEASELSFAGMQQGSLVK